MKKMSSGRIEIKVYPDQRLGNDHEMIDAAQKGEIDIILPPTAKLSSVVPALQFVDLPFSCEQKKDLYEILDGEIGQQLLEKLVEFDLVGAAFWESGFKQFTANKLIRSPDDFRGLKIRTMKNSILMDQFKAFGAQPVPIDFHQTYTALKNGVVDGQENPLV